MPEPRTSPDLRAIPWQRRAEAAERTAHVLKGRLRAIDAGDEKTAIQRQLEAAQRRSLDVERRRALSELRGTELQRYSAQLEQDVAARTEQIRTILMHVSTGFLLLGPDLCVEQGWSHSCETLLTTADLARRLFPTLLGWDLVQGAEFGLSVAQVFEDVLPEQLTLYQLAKRATHAGRELELSYSVVRKDGAVARLLVTIVDVSAQIAAERAARHHERLVHILTQREAFTLYLLDARRLLREAMAAEREQDTAFIRRAVHTIKGNSATFGLDELATVCHDVESQAQIDGPALERIEHALHTFLERNHKVLGIDPDQTDAAPQTYVMTQSLIDALAHKAQSSDHAGVERLLAKLRERPANDFIEPLRSTFNRLSERLQKDAELRVRGADVAFDPTRLGPVLQCLPHLVRNALDHGIEPPHERGSKPRRGTVEVAFVDHPEAWEIQVADDGRGVDPARIRELALQRGILGRERLRSVSPEGTLGLLTADGFSTACELSEISGRGVGLSAVRQAVESLGGEMKLDSEPGRGTRFCLRVPKLRVAIV